MKNSNNESPLLTVEAVVMDAVHSAQTPNEGRHAVSTVLPAGRY